MLGYLSADIICSEKRTVSYEEQIMSKDKYPSIFSPQMEAIVFIILQIFFATRAIFKIGEYLTIIPWARVGYEMVVASLAITISYPTSASGIIVLLKTPPKYRKLDYNKNRKAQKITHNKNTPLSYTYWDFRAKKQWNKFHPCADGFCH